MGLAAISGKFKKQGLSYRIEGDDIATTWNGRHVDYDKAAMKLFGINENQAYWLFTPMAYPYGSTQVGAVGERNVVARIKKVIASKDPHAND